MSDRRRGSLALVAPSGAVARRLFIGRAGHRYTHSRAPRELLGSTFWVNEKGTSRTKGKSLDPMSSDKSAQS